MTVTSPGYTRRPKGDAWVFLDVEGLPLADEEEVARCERLAVPPAWSDVWICRYPNGHIQAFGRDLAGRGQYLYHEQWQVRRARRKHDHVLDVGRGAVSYTPLRAHETEAASVGGLLTE